MEEEEEEDGTSEQPLDFSLPALCGSASTGVTKVTSPARKFSVIMSPWKK